MDGNWKVLLAEDEEMHFFPISVALRRRGFEVLKAENKEEVLEQGLKADALVIDARLPSEKLEGLWAAAELVKRGLDPAVPLIFVSVYAENTDTVQKKLTKLRGQLKGRYIWLEKWFEPSNLVELVWSHLNEKGVKGRTGGM